MRSGWNENSEEENVWASSSSDMRSPIFRSLIEWERYWKKPRYRSKGTASSSPNTLATTTTIKYLARPETRGFDLVQALNEITSISDNDYRAWKCETVKEFKILKAWKQWDVFAEYIEEALETREYRAILYIHLGYLMDEEVFRVVEMTHKKCNDDITLNRDSILHVIQVMDKWYSTYFDATTGTSTSLSGGYQGGGGVSSDTSAEDLKEEEKSADMELLILWLIRTRLFLLGYVNTWLKNSTCGKDLVELYHMIQYGEEGGCLVDTEHSILRYDVRTFIQACEALYRGWLEFPFSPSMLQYIELLKARFGSLCAVMLKDVKTFNIPELCDSIQCTTSSKEEKDTTTPLYYGNVAFYKKCNSTLGNVERSLNSFRNFLCSMGRLTRTPKPYNTALGKPPTLVDGVALPTSKELHSCFSEWACDFTRVSREEFIVKNFRKHIIAALVRPGEYIEYRQKNPLGEPNATNIISKLRPNDMIRYRKNIITAKLHDVISSTSDAVGMVTARSELAIACIEYFCNEASIARFDWSLWFTRKKFAKASLLRGKTCFPMVIQTVGGYIVWCPWMQYLPHKKKRRRYPTTPTMSTCKLYSVLRFHEAFHLACVLLIRHYRDIFRALMNKHSNSSTRTAKNIAKEVTDMYEHARRILIHIYGGCCLDEVMHAKLFEGTDYSGGMYILKQFDRDAYIQTETKRMKRAPSSYATLRAQREFIAQEEKRRKDHYKAARCVHIPPTRDESDLFPELFSTTTNQDDETEIGIEDASTRHKYSSQDEIVRVNLTL